MASIPPVFRKSKANFYTRHHGWKLNFKMGRLSLELILSEKKKTIFWETRPWSNESCNTRCSEETQFLQKETGHKKMGGGGETWEERRGRDLRAAASSSLDFQKAPSIFPEEKNCAPPTLLLLLLVCWIFFFLFLKLRL